mmetsp:Transcript_139815/g.363458  ORF Transcript_139815/g.363458 Transcript_139815/m.363458 type:complete len:255 (+) Transcript_139815:288-1052(+)
MQGSAPKPSLSDQAPSSWRMYDQGRSSLHDRAEVLDRRRRWQFPLPLVGLQAPNWTSVFLLVERPPTHEPLETPVPLLLRSGLVQVEVLVPLLLVVVAGPQGPSNVVAGHGVVWPVGAVLVWSVGDVEHITMHTDQQALVVCVVGSELCRGDCSNRLLIVSWQLHMFRSGNRAMSSFNAQALLFGLGVLRGVQGWRPSLRIEVTVEVEQLIFPCCAVSSRLLAGHGSQLGFEGQALSELSPHCNSLLLGACLAL